MARFHQHPHAVRQAYTGLPLTWLWLGLVGIGTITGCRLASPVIEMTMTASPSVAAITAEAARAIDSELQDLADEVARREIAGTVEHHLCMLNTGDDALLARIHLIRSARQFIDFQTFIWVNDECGQFIYKELLQAARRGVRVRLLDDQFSVAEDPNVLALMGSSHPNFTIRFFKPLFSDNASNNGLDYLTALATRFRWMNQRMHNKVIIVDGRIGLVGGRNVQNKYFDRSATFNFKDRDVIVVGRAVRDMSRSFESYWNHPYAKDVLEFRDVMGRTETLGQRDSTAWIGPFDPDWFEEIDKLANRHSLASTRASLTFHEVKDVQFIADPPVKPGTWKEADANDTTEQIRVLCQRARHLVVFQSPYLVLSRRGYRALRHLRREKRDVAMIFSSNGLASADHVSAYAIAWKQRKKVVQKLNLQIHQLKPFPGDVLEMMPRYDWARGVIADPAAPWRGGRRDEDPPVLVEGTGPRLSIHAKSLVVDSRFAYIGSHNFDPRSARLNTECGIIVEDEMFARALQADILNDCAPRNSWLVARRPNVPLLGHLSSFIASISAALPVLDIWPFRYTASYDLKRGANWVSPGDRSFYDHFDHVGQFPGVSSVPTILQTRIIRSMAGFAAPLM